MPSTGIQEKKTGSGKKTGVFLALGALAVLAGLAIFLLRGRLQSQPPLLTPPPVSDATPTPAPQDKIPPEIQGARDMTTAVGMSLSYRSGVTAHDEVDGSLPLQVDASAVDLTQPGEYPVLYWAEDRSGNRGEVRVTVTVVSVSGVDDDDPTIDVSGELPPPTEPPIKEVTREMVDEAADQILSRITTSSMSDWEKAQAIYNYVHTHVKYVGTSDKSSWLMGAYVGFTRGRGDCYNYFACSKALLTQAGIPNVDLYRVGGSTDHYWQLVNVGSGWYHFDACPHPNSYPLNSFLLDEAAVRAYTEKCTPVRTNYYVYDYANCPVTVVGTPVEELPPETVDPSRPEEPTPGPTEELPVIPPEAETTPLPDDPALEESPVPEATPTPEPKTPENLQPDPEPS